MNFSIRYATIKDADLIAHLSRSTFYDSFAAQNTKEDMDKFLNEQFTFESLVEEVALPGYTFLLSFYQNEACGYACLRERENPAALKGKNALEISRIYVAREYIGKGVGHLLMKESLKHAEERKKEVIWLGVWEKNERAISFYRSWGFDKFDEHDFILGNDVQRDWLMKKML